MLTPEQWHAHFCYQAKWTKQVRQHFFSGKAEKIQRILEVGCGTGAIIGSTSFSKQGHCFGLDCSFGFLDYCSRNDPQVQLTCGNAYHLPFHEGVFDITFCHFLLLWLKQPLTALKEMVRVTRKDGWVSVFAEPDHEARIDYPQSIEKAGKAQALSLQKQGADLQSGRKLGAWMLQCGLRNIEVGILGANWRIDQCKEVAEEKRIFRHDLEWLSDEEKSDAVNTKIEDDFRQSVIFVPTFYAWGQV